MSASSWTDHFRSAPPSPDTLALLGPWQIDVLTSYYAEAAVNYVRRHGWPYPEGKAR